MAVSIVDVLEMIDVVNQQRQLATIALRTGQFTLEVLHKITLVVNLSEAVDCGQPVDLFVVGVFDIAAGEELENRPANLDQIAVA